MNGDGSGMLQPQNAHKGVSGSDTKSFMGRKA